MENMQSVQVFRICECDAVAARSMEEAVEWYKEQTGLSDDDLYDAKDIEVVSMDDKIYLNEARNESEKISVREIINRYWNGEPFIAFTTEW